jgi:hypothetical protein
MQGLGVGPHVEDLPYRLLTQDVRTAQSRKQAGVDDRRLTTARTAYHRHDIGRRALSDLSDQFVNKSLPAEK